MLYLLYQNLISFITRHRLVFSLFCVSQVVSILAVLFMYGLFSSNQAKNAQYNSFRRTLTVQSGTSFDGTLKGAMETLCSQKAGELQNVTAHLERQKINATALNQSDALQLADVSFGRYFTAEELRQGERKLVASSRLCKGEKIVGDALELLGKPYEIIGFMELVAGEDAHEIPFASLTDFSGVTSIAIVLKQDLTRAQLEEWTRYLEGLFPASFVKGPEPADLRTEMRNLSQLLTSTAVGLIAVLNFSYLYRYVLERRKSTYAVLRICGCTRRTGFRLFAGEALALSSVLFWLCAGGFHFGLSRLYDNISDIMAYAMGWTDFLFLYLIYLAVVLLVFSFTIRRYARLSPRQLYQEGTP